MASSYPSPPTSPTAAGHGDQAGNPVTQRATVKKGLCFPSQKECTAAMRAYAAANGMTVRLDPGKHGGAFLTYKCEGGDECRFKVTAHRTKSEGQNGYVIGKCQLEHNQCGRVAKLTSAQIRHEPLVISLVASDTSISARAIAEHVQRLKAAIISENEAHRGKKLILDDLYGPIEEGFQKLESLVKMWGAKNPTSITECDFNDAGEFVRVFISHPYAALYAQNGQQVAGVDGAFLRHGMYRSIQLVLVGRDGDNKNIVLAVAMCASESGENCEWFFRCCIRAGVKLHETPLFSDRGSGILAALKTLSVGTLRYCTRHILNNIRDEFKGRCPPDIKNVLYRVQGAQSIEEYDSIIKTLELTHKEIGAYIRAIEPEHWVLYTALRSCRLYGWRSTNFVESQNAAAIDTRRMLPFQCLESIMKKFMTSACRNREKIAPVWVSAGHKITSYANKNLNVQSEAAAFCAVEPSEGDHLYVFDRRSTPRKLREVDLDARSCTCAFYDQYGIPCKHYIAALNHRNRGIEKYACVDACYTIEAYTNLYGSGQQRIQLVLPEELIVNGDHRPPKLAEKKKGKKRDRRFPSKGDTTLQVGKSKRKMKCSNCGQPGHNKRGCTSK